MKICLYFIKLYRSVISPYSVPRCRFLPTCSSYAEEAIMVHGLRKGILLTVKRILKCNIFSKQRVDNVPEKENEI